MKLFRAIVVAVTMLAVLTAPVLAVAVPCCCTKQAAAKLVEPQRPCCRAAAQRALAAVGPHACCAKKVAQQPGPQTAAGCCCVKAAPVLNTPRNSVQRAGGDEFAVSLAFVPADFDVRAAAVRYLDLSPGRFTVSGPPLLALYCTWLK